ncbi:DEKNAAC103927 [Brettanomyces naardenensis]|uniref:U three protein 23 n=1 Tax=Brettanomyces naardenensis TaxID=13370 RepID=A0A448YPT1_BRENA|nr:DEKNAAC103927 [Brettanomyces naardenensis]
MRQKRAKAYRKQMNVYRMTFKFKPPIQVLVDSNAVLEAEKSKFDLKKGIDRTVQMETKLFITQCCINHLYETGNQPAIDIAKTMEKRRCHHKETMSSYECIKSITDVGGHNKFRYVVVTQDEKLRRSLREVPAVPLIYMNRSVMIMEPMSKVSERVVGEVERRKLVGGLNDAKRAGLMDGPPSAPPAGRSDDGGSGGKDGKSDGDGEAEGEDEDEDDAPNHSTANPRHKRRGPKQPNPLSVKKKKIVKETETVDKTVVKKSRKRRHGSKI